MSKIVPATATYNPDRLLDAIIVKLHLKNDAALSRALEVAPPVISKIRHRTLPIGATSRKSKIHPRVANVVFAARKRMAERQMRTMDATPQPTNIPRFFHCDEVPRQTVCSGMLTVLTQARRRTSGVR